MNDAGLLHWLRAGVFERLEVGCELGFLNEEGLLDWLRAGVFERGGVGRLVARVFRELWYRAMWEEHSEFDDTFAMLYKVVC